MADIRTVRDMNGLITYFSENLGWEIDLSDFDDIDDISYEFEAEDIGLKDEAFAKIASLRQLQPMTPDQQWGIFCIEFESQRFEVSAIRKILSGLIPRRRASVDHAVWQQQDLLFICNWGEGNNKTLGFAHFEDKEKGLPQIKMISCAPAIEDFTQIKQFEENLKQLSWPRNTSDIDAWREQWSSAFSVSYHEVIQTSSALTVRLAAEAQNIRDLVLATLEVENENGYVHQLYKKFQQALIHDMTETAFADMYAQTVVYGLFSARCMDPTQDDFSVREAVNCIPNTNPFLRELMRECLGADSRDGEYLGASKRLYASFDELDIGNVVDLLAHTNTDAIIRDFNRQTGGGREDPIIHFYEEFLTAYDKQQKVQRGVFYTPQPVVNFIVRAVDDILKNEFGYEDGLASTATKAVEITRKSKKKNERGFYYDIKDEEEVPAVQVLDPATGTGTFLRQVILQIYENFRAKHKGESEAAIKAAWNEYVPKHLLPRINGFELMMAPYAVAHMKLAMVLHDTGYEFGTDARLNVCLTNTLEPPGDADDQMSMFSMDPLAMESIQANKVKTNNGISLIIGNPPYAGESANKGEWILSLMEVYKKEPGGFQRLNEKNPKWINDDYVKFIRYAETILENKTGVMAYICPHGYIDNPTFRGMRWKLGTTYDHIYILDLHGNAKKRETAPDGSKDENVFDIQQGVCIVIMVKRNKLNKGFAEINFFDLYGTREKKYEKLNCCRISNIGWEKVISIEPFYLFKPNSINNLSENLFDTSKIFIKSVLGFQTHRDNFAIGFSREEIENRVRILLDEANSNEWISQRYNISDTNDWQVSKARERLRALTEDERNERITLCQYRLYDTRWCFLDEAFMDRPRRNVYTNVSNKNNIVFGVGRQGLAVGNIEWCLATISKYAMDANIFRRGGITASPLYLYQDGLENDKRTPNLCSDFIDEFSKQLGLPFSAEKENSQDSFSPIDVVDYVYAVLYSHKYRSKFADALKIDYPQIPYPSDSAYFWTIVAYGKKLRSLHTMSEDPPILPIYYNHNGPNLVEKYMLSKGKIYINKTQFFEKLDNRLDDDWEYVIGGTQPLQKWLKDRKGLTLSTDDIKHYETMIMSIAETRRIMDEIDLAIKL